MENELCPICEEGQLLEASEVRTIAGPGVRKIQYLSVFSVCGKCQSVLANQEQSHKNRAAVIDARLHAALAKPRAVVDWRGAPLIVTTCESFVWRFIAGSDAIAQPAFDYFHGADQKAVVSYPARCTSDASPAYLVTTAEPEEHTEDAFSGGNTVVCSRVIADRRFNGLRPLQQ